jgi:hypothetical protein
LLVICVAAAGALAANLGLVRPAVRG